jgi:Zn-dependent oligopeptidase
VIHPWDISYVYTAYEKAIFNIDAEEIAKYFPVKKTIEKMIELYSLFFGLEMRLISYDKDIGKSEWNTFILEIRKKNDIKGHLLFDLYPREGKYSHACFSNLVSSVFKENQEGLRELPLGLIIANFNKPTVLHDGLMKYEEARTLFHEMGHAMHHFLATTEFVSHSGTSTLHDFVEVPSQLFEQWFLEKPIIKQVSSHYLSGDALADPVIENIIKLEFYNMGLFIQRQINSSLMSLHVFTKNEEEIEVIRQSLAHKTISLSYYDNVFNQSVYSFGHITPGVYGPKYYVYLWSLVYAIDFFKKINATENGLYAAEMGKDLEEIVLQKAGFEDPEELSKLFLKRDLSFDSFYAYLNK